ncbi:MAG TPA: hypothetical protein VK812_14405 [Candidatus Binatus sp.]|jgi:hypothetical protein|nr:hypothetical protein [Candidatus Binatus sp.]
MFRRSPLLAALGAAFLAMMMTSCGSPSIPNAGRVLLAIAVTPAFADAQQFGGQVVFTATGTFSVAPSPAPVTFALPYTGGFAVAPNSSNQVIASIVSTGTGTATVQCEAGMSGTVEVGATALANNGTSTIVSGAAQITCP